MSEVSKLKMSNARLGKSINAKEMAGKIVGKWTVLKRVSKIGGHEIIWRCRCKCGRIKNVSGSSLRRGSKSCLSCSKITHGYDDWRHGKVRPEYTIFMGAKGRAKYRGIPFSISLDDIKIPKRCPLLGLPLRPAHKGFQPNSPSIDRKDCRKGYVKGNVWIISFRANRIKTDATLEELEKLVKNLRKSL